MRLPLDFNPPHNRQRLAMMLAVSLFLGWFVPLTFRVTNGQERGQGVKIKVENGRVIDLYDESHALVIGVSDYNNGWRKLPGVVADVALLDANPLEKIENKRRIAAVIVNGRFLSKDTLQRKLIVERKNILRISQGMLTLLSLAAILASGSCDRGEQGNWLLTTARFEQLMQTISDGWNEGNAQKAANCFTEDAIYSAPPDLSCPFTSLHSLPTRQATLIPAPLNAAPETRVGIRARREASRAAISGP